MFTISFNVGNLYINEKNFPAILLPLHMGATLRFFINNDHSNKVCSQLPLRHARKCSKGICGETNPEKSFIPPILRGMPGNPNLFKQQNLMAFYVWLHTAQTPSVRCPLLIESANRECKRAIHKPHPGTKSARGRSLTSKVQLQPTAQTYTIVRTYYVHTRHSVNSCLLCSALTTTQNECIFHRVKQNYLPAEAYITHRAHQLLKNDGPSPINSSPKWCYAQTMSALTITATNIPKLK